MSKKKKPLLILLYIVFLIILFEGSTRLFFLIPQVSERPRIDDDYSWRRAWVRRHQRTNKEIYYKFDMHDPSKGWISKPNLRDVKVFKDKVLNTNAKGFRGKKDFLYGKNQDRIRILILGDSFTFGDGVSDDETYSHFLQEMLPHAEVINLGVHGYGHDQMLILFKEVGVKYEPDIVIVGFISEDMTRNLLEFRDYAKPRFVIDAGKLKLTGTPVPRPEHILQWDWTRPRVLDAFSIINHGIRVLSGRYEEEKKDVTTAILSNIIELADSIHATPIFAYLPFGREISPSSTLTKEETYLFSTCEEHDKVYCFSTRPHFAAKSAKGEIFKEGHWGPAGHLTVAEAIKKYLVDKGYFASPQPLGDQYSTAPVQ